MDVVVSTLTLAFQLDDSFPEGDALGSLKYPVRDILDAFEMNIHRPFSLQNSGAESVLNLRLSLRVSSAAFFSSHGSLHVVPLGKALNGIPPS